MISWHWNTFPITGPSWGESTIPPHKGPVVLSFDVSSVINLNKLLNIQLSCQWFQKPQCSCDITLTMQWDKWLRIHTIRALPHITCLQRMHIYIYIALNMLILFNSMWHKQSYTHRNKLIYTRDYVVVLSALNSLTPGYFFFQNTHHIFVRNVHIALNMIIMFNSVNLYALEQTDIYQGLWSYVIST